MGLLWGNLASLGLILTWAAGMLPGWFQAQSIEMRTPPADAVLQGVVTIEGTTDVSGFQQAEISFAYQTDALQTWFLIQESDQPVGEGVLASWDTTTLSDGEYRLRLQVHLQDGQVLETIHDHLRVRNYTAVETPTPPAPTEAVHQEPIAATEADAADAVAADTADQVPPTYAATPLPTVQPFTTDAMPTNPAQISTQKWFESGLVGAVIIVGILFLGVIYWGIRSISR